MENPVYYSWTKRVLLLACLAPAPAYAQDLVVAYNPPDAGNQTVQSNSRALKHLLKDLETRFGIFFTYKSAALQDKIVQVEDGLLAGNASWKQVEPALASLLARQQLKYRKIDNIYVIYADDDRINFRELERRAIETGSYDAGRGLAPVPPQVVFARLGSVAQYLPARDVSVTGWVTTDDGQGLPGVNVLIKGSSTGTTTDANGGYTISVPDNNAVLVFSFIGYVAEEVAVGGRTIVDVTMLPDVQSLNEVVVIGYGTQQRKDLVGAVGVATAKDFGDVNVSNVGQLVQGKIAGVQVVNNSGLPGSGTNIIVRGTGSFTNSSPLYVIDGIQSDGGTFNSLSPYDIQDITVLKDASSIAIYGAQGANGVVIVTTRKAKTGAPRVIYNGYFGLAQPWKKLDVLNASQYVDLVRDIGAAKNITLPPKLNSEEVLVDRTDWQDEIFRTARLTEHHVNVGGGSEKLTYNVSLGYTNQQSIMVGYDFQRFNLRFNLEETIGKRVKLGQNVNLRYSITDHKDRAPDFLSALRMPPYAPVYDPSNPGGFSKVTTIDDINDAYNPLTNVLLSENIGRDLLNYAQLYGEIDLFTGLKFRSQAAFTFNNYSNYNFLQANQNGNINNADGITETYGWNIIPLIENILTYNKQFGMHSLNVTAGNTYRSAGIKRAMSNSGSGFNNNYDIRQIGVVEKAVLNPAGGTEAGIATSALISYFGRVNYSLMDKYLLTLSFRRDGASVFGPNNRYGNFPSVGVAWRLSQENFFKGISAVSDLKVRASWGKSGNANIPGFVYESLVFRGAANNIVYSLGDDRDYALGATVAAAANPDLRWEETTQTDVGLDLGLMNNRLSFTFDYYNRQNNGLLVNVPMPLSSGLGGTNNVSTAILSNAASAFNRGVELSATYAGNIGGFTYSVSANGAYNQNEVTSLGTKDATPIVSGGFDAVAAITRTAPGYPVGAFWGYRMDHVAVDQADVDSYNEMARGITGDANAMYQESLKPGDIIFKDLNSDGKITEKDQEYLGSPIPKWNYGANVNLGFKNFDFMLSFQGVGGVQLVNALKYWTEGTSRPFNSSTAVLRRWRQEGDVTDMPRAGQNTNLNLRPSDRYVESGNYLRVRNLTLGYSLPQTRVAAWTGNTLSSFRVYVTAQNALTFTKYSGYDPEVSAQDQNLASSFLFSRGIDNGQYPQPRTFMLGLQVGF